MPDDDARQLLKKALGRLSVAQRQVVILRLRGESDMGRIAAGLALEPNAVRASLAFATAQLRMMLSDTPQQPEQTDWLLRCQALLAPRARAVAAAPTQADTMPSALITEPAPAVSASPQASSPLAAAPDTPPQRAAGAPWLLPWLPAALMLLIVITLALLAWHLWWPSAQTPAATTSPARTEPERMPPPSAPQAPLTAPDFSLVLLRQQHPGLVEELDFHVWLSEQDAFQ